MSIGSERESDGDARESVFFVSIILVITAIAYAPLIGQVWELSSQTTQALNAFVLLGVAFVDALLSVFKTRAFHLSINPHGLLLFGLSCLALAVASFTSIWGFAILGLCLNIGALLSFCFGRSGVAMFYPALAGFGVLVGMLVMVPDVDARLRVLAGSVSARLLPVLGIRADLLVQPDPFQVLIVAEKGAGVFNVAAECNGFGILVSSVVLTLILALRRRLWWGATLILLGLSVVIGLLFNGIRIVAIAATNLKTNLPYGVIHEGLGTVVYLMALATVCLISVAVARRRP